MKPFKTIEEQYNLLESRGIIFNDEKKAKEYLLNNNYYNVVNCFGKFFMDSQGKYLEGSTFDEITLIHYFDKEIKSVFFKYILEAEKHLRAIIAYRYSEFYRNQKYSYLIATNYNPDKLLETASLITKLSRTITRHTNSKAPNSIKHYMNNHNDIPFWVLSNYLTFGDLVKFYSFLEEKLQNKIAKDFSTFLCDNLGIVSYQLTNKSLLSFFYNILTLRNAVAHNNMIYDLKCKKHTVYNSKLHSQYNINKNDSRQDIYNIFVVLQCVLTKNQYAQLHNTILKCAKTLDNKLTTINANAVLTRLGFPIDWCKNTSLKSQL